MRVRGVIKMEKRGEMVLAICVGVGKPIAIEGDLHWHAAMIETPVNRKKQNSDLAQIATSSDFSLLDLFRENFHS